MTDKTRDSIASPALFKVKTIGLSKTNGRKPCTLDQAARHNLREIQAEHGADGHIDARRMSDNIRLAGPETAAQVLVMRDRLLATVDTSKLKRDHVQGIEVVFCLPPGSGLDEVAFFDRCLQWLRQTLPMPVLLATIHRDEAAPHAHVLMLPVKDGKHIGGALIDRPNVKRLHESFFHGVAGPAGLKRSNAKLRGMSKKWAVVAVLRECESMGLPDANGPLWPVWRAAIERDPTEAIERLMIDLNSIRQSYEEQATSPIALDESPIALQKKVAGNEGLSCVALADRTPTAQAKQQAQMAVATTAHQPTVIESLGRLWDAVGYRSEWNAAHKLERLKVARQAQQRGIDRHRTPPRRTPQPPVVRTDGDGLIRVQDEYAHDLTAWD